MNRVRFALMVAAMAAVGVVFGGVNSRDAHASPANYDWATSAINFYTDNTILYEFSGLDTTAGYAWFIELTDDFGVPFQRIGTHTSVGSATATWFHGNDVNSSQWPQNYTGPMRVVDNYGNVLGQHFMAPRPNDDWATSDGVTPDGLKQSPANTEHAGVCAAPPYWALNVDGYHHSYNPCSVTVTKSWPSSYFLLHFRLDVADYGDDDVITFSPLGTVDHEVGFNLDHIIDYNTDEDWTGGLSEVNTWSFVVVNTGDRELPFIDYEESESAFDPTDGLVFDRDPHKASYNPLAAFTAFDYGAYSCQRLTSGFIWQSDCESVILVSRHIPLVRNESEEWEVEPQINPIGSGGTQTVAIRQRTEEIWSGYSGAWSVTDCNDVDCDTDDDIDNTVYSYASERLLNYTVDTLGVEAEDEEHRVMWQVVPISVNGGTITAADLQFNVGFYDDDAVYTISEAGGIGGGLRGFFSQVGFGTPLGKSIIFLIVVIIATGGAVAMKTPFLVQLIAFTASGGTMLAMGFRTNLLVAAFVAVIFVLWAAYFAGFGRESNADA